MKGSYPRCGVVDRQQRVQAASLLSSSRGERSLTADAIFTASLTWLPRQIAARARARKSVCELEGVQTAIGSGSRRESESSRSLKIKFSAETTKPRALSHFHINSQAESTRMRTRDSRNEFGAVRLVPRALFREVTRAIYV